MRSDYRIGNWIIRPRRGCIERGEETVHVNPRPLAVLKCLADAGGEVVTRDELFDAVWPGVIVTDDALTQCVVELRKAFGDSASDPQFIRTVPKVGFCLVAPVGPLTDESDDKPEPAGKAGPPGSRKWASLLIVGIVVLALALFWYLAGPGSMEERVPVEEIPSVAVLPFVNMSADEENDYLCRGVSETILNMLAQTPELHVASGTSSFQPRLKGLSLPEIADLLGVTTVLEGSVQRQGNRLRITAQLIEAENDAHLWSRISRVRTSRKPTMNTCRPRAWWTRGIPRKR
jgi:DNA-binding winged helix-turn-helix (wHTH) protein/TolB-like protein